MHVKSVQVSFLY